MQEILLCLRAGTRLEEDVGDVNGHSRSLHLECLRSGRLPRRESLHLRLRRLGRLEEDVRYVNGHSASLCIECLMSGSLPCRKSSYI